MGAPQPGPPGPPSTQPGPPAQPPGPPPQQQPWQPAPPTQPMPQQPPDRARTITEKLAATAVERERSESRGIVGIAIILALVAALVGLGYGGFALTMRRGIYADIEDDPTSVSKDDAESSDSINAVGLWVAGVLIGIAFVLMIVSMINARRGRNGLGIAGVVLVVVGGVAAAWALLMVNGVEDITEADQAVTGYLVAGPAFVVMAVGLILGMLGLRKPAKPERSRPAARAPFPTAPYGGPQGPYGQQPAGPYPGPGGQPTGQPPPGGPPYGGQGGNPYAR